MITPFDLANAVVVSGVGLAMVAGVCTWICDEFCSNGMAASHGVLEDLGIVLLFVSGNVVELVAWYFCFVFGRTVYWSLT